ncbi:MAG: response regulator [Fidelibacterota bacterium]
MEKSRGKILWIDDEIHHLKPHILFLEEKGYSVASCTNGKDGITLSGSENFDLVLLDQFMPGLDGIETLQKIKDLHPALPVVMITKSEEEWLMDRAISEKIAQLLIKPVNPTQIFMACKQVLENVKIREEFATRNYLQSFRDMESLLQEARSFEDWWNLYKSLVKWQLDFDEHRDINFGTILKNQMESCNKEFARFIEEKYKHWLSASDRPPLSVDIFKSQVVPLLRQDEKVFFLVVDAMRHDQFMVLHPLLSKYFQLSVIPTISILPSATPFSRNALFSGLFPEEFCRKYPEQLGLLRTESGSMNSLEEQFLHDQLIRFGLGEKTYHYHKIWQVDHGQKFQSRVSEYLQQDLLAVVVNFVDQLAHRRSESDVLKEIVPDESGYRQAILNWFEQSWLFKLLKVIAAAGFKIVMTSDHGSIMVSNGVVVSADRTTSTGVRYKYGRNLNLNERHALIIRNPEEYKLPQIVKQTNYILAKKDVFFIYPNQQQKYEALLKGSFQHGGVSMEEILVPVFTMEKK